MSDDKLPLSISREALEEMKSLLRGADPDAPLVDRLRNPRTPYSPALLREEAADRIEELEAKLEKTVEALRFYAWDNEIRLPSDGPWGAGSTDFGAKARTTLAELTGGKDE